MKLRTGPPVAQVASPATSSRRWLLLVHQLPSMPSNLRVRTWRRLQQIGAIPVKQAVYVLPDSPAAREDFEWLRTEIKGAGGDATVFAADSVDTWSDDALVDEFRRARQDAYLPLAREIERALRRLTPSRSPGTRGRRGSPARPQRAGAAGIRRLTERFRTRLAAIERVDFFGSPGRDRAATLLAQLEEQTSGPDRTAIPRPAGSLDARDYRSRLWVTRPRPGVDRMASAWLIGRFVDPQARFDFVPDRESAPDGAVTFDMFGVEFSHHGDGCTFETLCAAFGVQSPPVARIATIVHDLDLKDGRFGSPEAPAIGSVIEGLQLSMAADQALLAHGIALFEALYRAFERPPSAAPRPAVRARARRTEDGPPIR